MYSADSFEASSFVTRLSEVEEEEFYGIEMACDAIPIQQDICINHPASCQSTQISISNFENTIKQRSPRFWLGHHSILTKKWKRSQSTENWYIAALDSIFNESEKKIEKKFQNIFFFKKKIQNFKKKSIFFLKMIPDPWKLV